MNTVIEIDRRIINKVMAWIDACDVEVGGIMSIVKTERNVYKVLEAYMPRQIADGTYLELEDVDSNAIKRKHNEDELEFKRSVQNKVRDETFALKDLVLYERELRSIKRRKGKLVCQWHSHVNMGCGPSNTDKETGRRMSEYTDFVFMLILNKKREHQLDVYISEPVTASSCNIDLVITEDDITEYSKEKAEQEVRDNVFSTSTHTINESGEITKLEKGERWNSEQILEPYQSEFSEEG